MAVLLSRWTMGIAVVRRRRQSVVTILVFNASSLIWQCRFCFEDVIFEDILSMIEHSHREQNL